MVARRKEQKLPFGKADPYQFKLDLPRVLKVIQTDMVDVFPWKVFPVFEKDNLPAGAEKEAELGIAIAAFRSKEAAESFVFLMWPSKHAWEILYLPNYVDPE